MNVIPLSKSEICKIFPDKVPLPIYCNLGILKLSYLLKTDLAFLQKIVLKNYQPRKKEMEYNFLDLATSKK